MTDGKPDACWRAVSATASRRRAGRSGQADRRVRQLVRKMLRHLMFKMTTDVVRRSNIINDNVRYHYGDS
jgi:hypothetical protein